ncbi:MAG: hypothetical protein ISS87_01270 [Candidatus Pacebacteria bacterium]|nr:hypothetical protein [Candidatus Paceibacterota bacterium]
MDKYGILRLTPQDDNKKLKNQKGAIIMLVLVFGSIFFILFGGITGFIILQLRQSSQKLDWAQSLQIAESGINTCQWYYNHEMDCPFNKDFFDTQGSKIGEFSLEVISNSSCGIKTTNEILSYGWTQNAPDIKRAVKTILARISVGQYSYLLNDSVWAGADREIRGLYHSNSGIRMDGENQSLVTSSADPWLCTDSFGCNYLNCPDDCVREGYACSCPGVFTTTSNSNLDLFLYPTTLFDFDGITINLADIKSITSFFPQEKYWPPADQLDFNAKGYHVRFLENGNLEIWIITGLSPSYAYSTEQGWHYDYFIINNEYLYNTISIDPSCSVFFFEDNIWAEGKINGKITVVSADLLTPTNETDIVLFDDIEYANTDGSDGLALIGQRNVLIGPNSPNSMELKGIFIAQKGHFGRNHYSGNIKEQLEIYGSVVSNGRVGTQWTSGSVIVSGYLKRENYFDSNLVYFYPPFVPHIKPDFEIVNWEEVK